MPRRSQTADNKEAIEVVINKLEEIVHDTGPSGSDGEAQSHVEIPSGSSIIHYSSAAAGIVKNYMPSSTVSEGTSSLTPATAAPASANLSKYVLVPVKSDVGSSGPAARQPTASATQPRQSVQFNPAGLIKLPNGVTLYNVKGNASPQQTLTKDNTSSSNDAVLRAIAKVNTAKVAASTVSSNQAKPQKSDLTGETIYRCEQCDYWSHNKYYWKQHVDLVHNAERAYKCPFCDYAGKRSHSLKEHLVVHSNYRPYECGLCNASFRKKGHLTNHIKMHSSSANQQQEKTRKGAGPCPLCGGPDLPTLAKLYEHFRKQHADDENVYLCEYCEFGTTQTKAIILHMHGHGNPKSYRCNVCTFPAPHFNLLREHFKASHPQTLVSYTIVQAAAANSVILMKCTECGFTAGSTDALKQHMLTHIDKNAAEKSASNSANVANQDSPQLPNTSMSNSGEISTQENASTAAYKCAQCPFTCQEAFQFIKHMLSHKPKQPARQPTATTAATTSTSSGLSESNSAIIAALKSRRRVIENSSTTSSSANDVNLSTATSKAVESKTAITPTTVLSNEGAICIQPQEEDKLQPEIPGARPVPSMGGPTQHWYQCTICGYLGQQRTIKAHIWKHSGHKDISYPMFQNGPLSVYDETPIGEPQIVNKESGVVKKSMEYIKRTTEERKMIVLGKQKERERLIREKSDLCVRVIDMDVVKTLALQREKINQSAEAASAVHHIQSTDISRNEVTDTTEKANVRENENVEQVIEVMLPEEGEIQEMEVDTGETIDGEEYVIYFSADEEVVNAEIVTEDVDNANETCEIAESLEVVSSPSTLSASSPEVVRALKRKPDDEEGRDGGRETPSKKLCLTPSISTSPPVVVAVGEEACVEVVTTEDGTPAAVQEEVLPSADDTEETNSDEAIEKDVDQNFEEEAEADEEEALDDYEDHMREQEMQTLLKLLKARDKSEVTSGSFEESDIIKTAQARIQQDQAASGSKSGICSSLLAVIEQLRERSKSMSEGEGEMEVEMEADDSSGGETGPPTRGRPKRRRAAAAAAANLEENQNVERTARGAYRCKLCHYNSMSAALMRTHMRLHKMKAPHECSLCDFEAASSSELQDHMLKHCKVRTFQCKKCLAVFNYKSQLRAHLKAHSDLEHAGSQGMPQGQMSNVVIKHGGHRCERCSELFEEEADYNKHMRHCRTRSQHCEHCGQFFGVRHKCSRSKPVQQCKTCSFSTTSNAAMKQHCWQHLKEQQQQPVNLQCQLCDFYASSVRSLKSHMKRHTNDRRFVQQPLEQYKCNLCGYVCHHLPSLKSHMWRHAADSNYSFEITNEVINKALDFDNKRDRLKQDTDLNPDAQDENEKTTDKSTSTSTKPPITNATSMITFRCCQCGFETVEKGELNKHMLTHMDIIKKTLEVNRGRLLGKLASSDQGAREEGQGAVDALLAATGEAEGEGELGEGRGGEKENVLT